MTDNSLEDLQQVPETTYGVENYQNHLLEQYKLFVDMADRISERRAQANNYFLTINSLFLAVLGVLVQIESTFASGLFQLIITVVGMLLCFLWWLTVTQNKNLNSTKFEIIQEMELQLPLKPYKYEWWLVGRGRDPRRYLPFSHIERWIPVIVVLIYLVLLLLGIFCECSSVSGVL